MPKFNANLTMLFNEVPFLDRFQAAAEAGFKGVEYLFPSAFDKDAHPKALSQTIAECCRLPDSAQIWRR